MSKRIFIKTYDVCLNPEWTILSREMEGYTNAYYALVGEEHTPLPFYFEHEEWEGDCGPLYSEIHTHIDRQDELPAWAFDYVNRWAIPKIEFSDLNVFIGENGTGKTEKLESLEICRDSVNIPREISTMLDRATDYYVKIPEYRKIQKLVESGKIGEQGFLIWDNPETGIGPKIQKKVAEFLFELAGVGIQVFIATHSLFMIKELDLISSKRNIPFKFFGFVKGRMRIFQGEFDDMEETTSLDEALLQSDRAMDTIYED